MKRLKKFMLFLLLLLIAGIGLIYLLSYYVERSTREKVYTSIESLPQAHTVIILGASVYSDGKLSPVLQDRVDTGLQIYRQGKANQFLLSGDNREKDYDEVSAMKSYLLLRNVPAQHIFTDPAGLNTYDSMKRSTEVFNIPSAIVVTQAFHLPRTLFIANNLGLNYAGYPAQAQKYQTENSLIYREKLANFKAIYDLFIRRSNSKTTRTNPLTILYNH
jgi:SanA protein